MKKKLSRKAWLKSLKVGDVVWVLLPKWKVPQERAIIEIKFVRHHVDLSGVYEYYECLFDPTDETVQCRTAVPNEWVDCSDIFPTKRAWALAQ